MNVKTIIQNRREITSYEDKAIPDDVIGELVDAATLAPSGNNLPSREFIVIRNKETLNQLADTPATVSWLKGVSAAIVITGRPDVSKYWLQDSSIAAGFIWLTAVDQGLGAAFGAIYHAQDPEESEKREHYVRESLSIPNDRRITAILGLGYPAEHPGAKTPPENSDLVHYETFND
ncbi:nitroreductase [Salibacterium salarium]|uniref:nitroreductase family protein n=1 Tax=Salibacterium salarium TaxID=284579 RepID=UPI00277DA1F0|nr:nitroreductase family protein [Salibacterium salarium]MDQ0298159.1 nitroreductase [Salibacterium salarium]